MLKKEFLTVPIEKLIPYANNPRNNENAVGDVLESIEQCGDLDPIEVDEDFVILSGHTRLKAMQRRGQKTADVMRYTGLSEEQKRKYRYLANKTGERATWDMSKLELELKGLDLSDFDFPQEEFFSIDEIQEVMPLDGEAKRGEYFTVSLTFPSEQRTAIMDWMRKNKESVVQDILRKVGK